MLELLVSIVLIAVLFAILVPAVQQARESARLARCRNNLHNLGLACHNMQSNTGRFPSVGRLYPPGNWAYSCLFQLLPYADHASLHDAFDFRTHAASRENLPIINNHSVPLWNCPSDPGDSPQISNYLGNSGTGVDDALEQKYDGFLELNEGTRPADFTDGLSNTVAFSECAADDGAQVINRMIVNVPPRAASIDEWRTFESRCRTLRKLNGEIRRSRSPGMVWTEAGMGSSRYNHVFPPGSNSCQSGGSRNLSIVSSNSRHAGGVVSLLADGSVRVIRFGIDETVWKQLGDRNSSASSIP